MTDFREPHWTDTASAPMFSTVIDATGSGSNIYAIVGRAASMMRQGLVPGDRIDRLFDDVRMAGNYEAAVAAVARWFPIKREES